MPEERLQKILSQAGVASRRKAEELILEGRVTVNGKAVTELGSKADLDATTSRSTANCAPARSSYVYIALNKPDSVVTTVTIRSGAPRSWICCAASRSASIPSAGSIITARACCC